MRYGSVCSGIEAATVAWHPLGWEPAWFAEVDKHASKVLAHHYPKVPNYGDFTKLERSLEGSDRRIDLLVGGTPCQSFSVAGLRGGLTDERGNLALEFCRLAQSLRPEWILWENVPGVLSSSGGADFGSILRALEDIGYSLAWRVLDAQFFGVPQRRRRVFLVGDLRGDRAREVLFESGGLQRDSRSSGAQRPKTSGTSEVGTTEVLPFDRAQVTSWANGSNPQFGDPSHPLTKGGTPPAVSFHLTQDPISGSIAPCLGKSTGGMGVSHCLTKSSGKLDPTAQTYVVDQWRARKLTPVECERLQGFPDNYTDCLSDTQRYATLGNSMAVPVMHWIGKRIEALRE